MNIKKTAATLATAAIALTGCSAQNAGTPAQTPTPAASPLAGSAPVRVLAAASLKESFTKLIEDFKKEHPEVKFEPIELAGSQDLVKHVNEGEKADVLALASEKAKEPLNAPAKNAKFDIFAENTLVIITPKGNPKGIKTLQDLQNTDNKVVICEKSVPCGSATVKLFTAGNVTVKAVSEENNVKAVVAKVESGEADAGLVYVSDAKVSTKVDSVKPAEADKVVNRYPIAALSDNPAAVEFVKYVESDHGRKVLEDSGLVVPKR